MKQQRKTYAITQEEYNLFFSDDITIRQKKELAKKFTSRLRYFAKVFEDTDIDSDYFDFCYLVQNHSKKQKPTAVLDFTGEYACYYYSGGEDGIEGIKVSFLWDDEAVNKAVQQSKEIIEQEEEEKKRKKDQDNYNKSIIHRVFDETQIDFILKNLETFKKW